MSLAAPLLLVLAGARTGQPTEWERWQCEKYLPPHALASKMYVIAAANRDAVKRRYAGLPPDWRRVDEVSDATWRAEVWWQIVCAGDPDRTWQDRLWYWRQLVDGIGPADYLRGWWPNPVPRRQP